MKIHICGHPFNTFIFYLMTKITLINKNKATKLVTINVRCRLYSTIISQNDTIIFAQKRSVIFSLNQSDDQNYSKSFHVTH